MAEDGWHLACEATAIPEKKGFKVRIEDRDIALFRDGDHVFALDARCYHAGGPLHMGDIEDVAGKTCIRCPWHHYKFAVGTGECVGMGRITTNTGVKQRRHRVKVEDGKVFVKVNTSGAFPSDRYYTPQMERLFRIP
ncbi:Rieske domain-containing protein [Salpingoeca rosetta]|uniref:Rieske domain-containing protein n=1 Tax=Salpingoeca rosetta (strain ATCC 50818 / BSB-021) TaxID=946362 RepID=F2UHW0_SALR5|nr:Rieske domain-containing protein [Salpingoeca rosetta]EGD76709.1 Rieske domain-containing protein [Salpingoeca rosetta]|eukprot:XP_004991081.1 Rieske domain-containing protein [Salpingoeca rosetta]